MPLPKPIRLSDGVRKELNEVLAELRAFREEATRAENARIPGMDQQISRCDDCLDRLEKIKEVYFPRRA